MKYAKISGVVAWSGGKTVLSAGITTADDDHELVQERPDLWTDAGPEAHLAGPARRGAGRVETAAQAPGAKRTGGKRG